jgi:hypothetical protein
LTQNETTQKHKTQTNLDDKVRANSGRADEQHHADLARDSNVIGERVRSKLENVSTVLNFSLIFWAAWLDHQIAAAHGWYWHRRVVHLKRKGPKSQW